MLRPDDEAKLWRLRDDGDERARDSLIEAYAGIVYMTRIRVVPRVPPSIEAGDLESEGFIALVNAVDRFDPARGVKFRSFAITKVRGAMYEWLRREDFLTRDLRTALSRMDRAREEMAALGIRPTTLNLAARLGVTEARIAEWMRKIAAMDTIPMEQIFRTRGDDEDDPLDIASRAADPSPDPEQILLAADEWRREWLLANEALALLPERERLVVRAVTLSTMTHRQAAAMIGLSESGASQICRAGVARARRIVLARCDEENDER